MPVPMIYMQKMKALKSFVVDAQEKVWWKQILLNNENNALINNLIDQIEFLKNEFHTKDTVIKLVIKNSKQNNEYFQNKNNNDTVP